MLGIAETSNQSISVPGPPSGEDLLSGTIGFGGRHEPLIGNRRTKHKLPRSGVIPEHWRSRAPLLREVLLGAFEIALVNVDLGRVGRVEGIDDASPQGDVARSNASTPSARRRSQIISASGRSALSPT